MLILKRPVLFVLLNFGALAIGSLFKADGVNSDWYQGMNKAPWTPADWVFGSAWTTIMICFSFFMAFAMKKVLNQTRLVWFFLSNGH